MSLIIQSYRPLVVAAPKVYATWNPSDKAAPIVLSGGNLIASGGNAIATLRSTVSKSAGKWYWEIKVHRNSTYFNAAVGIATGAAGLNSYLGQQNDSNGYGYWAGVSPNILWNANPNTVFGTIWPNDAFVGVALDADARTTTFYVNGVSQGTVTYALAAGPLFAAASFYNFPDVFTANFGASPFAYTVPAGYNAGLYQ